MENENDSVYSKAQSLDLSKDQKLQTTANRTLSVFADKKEANVGKNAVMTS